MADALSVVPDPPKGSEPLLSDTTYNIIKNLNQLVLPAFGTFYFTMAKIWGWPNGQEVVGSIAALTIFLGVILGFASRSYKKSDAAYDGTLEITAKDENTDTFSLNLNSDPDELRGKEKVSFKVVER